MIKRKEKPLGSLSESEAVDREGEAYMRKHCAPREDLLFIIMAGGRGERLRPLTDNLPKPLVRLGHSVRIIDFTLLNCLAAGRGEVLVLTQYRGEMIEGYLAGHWALPYAFRGMKLSTLSGPRSPKGIFMGTADAVYQSLVSRDSIPPVVVVLAGDHVYFMDYLAMVDYHRTHGGGATVATVTCAPSEAHRFGLVQQGTDGKIANFVEKPKEVASKGGNCAWRPLVSMGIYAFTSDVLLAYLSRNQRIGLHDFGRDVLPSMAADGQAHCYRFTADNSEEGYWRDVGDLKTYWETSMDFVEGRCDGSGTLADRIGYRLTFFPGVPPLAGGAMGGGAALPAAQATP